MTVAERERAMNVRRVLKWLVVLCVIGPAIVYMRYCWFSVTDEMSRAVSPDSRWVVVVTRTIYASTFSDPTQAVQIAPADLSRHWTRAQILTQVDEKGDKSLNVMLEVRWLDAQTLQVSVAKRVAKFYEKKSRYDDVAIRYTTMSAQP